MTAFPETLPTARTPDPMAAPALRWGVLAPGGIASGFVDAMNRHTRQRVVAVGSRSGERAQLFASRHGIDRAYGSYEQLVADPDVDVVYVASPHSEHRAQAMLAIDAGKPVLVEKAFTRNAIEAREVFDAAAAAKLVAVEAMWTRFLPQTDVIRQLLADGVLGEVTTVLADHGQYFDLDPTSRLFDPMLAGGALLDLGVYPLSFALMVLGDPDSMVAAGSLTSTGVDAQVGMVLTAGRAQAVVNTTLLARTPTTASMSGTQARLELSGPFYAPAVLTLTSVDGRQLVRDLDPITGGGGLCYEAAYLASMIADGALDCPLAPASDTLAVLGLMDTARAQLGVRYPGEEPTPAVRSGVSRDR